MKPHRDKEWYEIQLLAGRDIKHIADYLMVPKREVIEDLQFYGLYNEPEKPEIKRNLKFEDIVVGDVVARGAILYTVTRKTQTNVTLKPWNKSLRTENITRKQWREQRFHIREEHRNIKRYNLNDTPEGQKELERIRKQCKRSEVEDE